MLLPLLRSLPPLQPQLSPMAVGGLEDGFHGNTAYEATLPNFPDPARGAFASAHKAVNSRSVYAPNGTYLGSDPDANVRLELRRDECRSGC